MRPLIPRAECAGPGGNLRQVFTRSWYSLVSVFTRILSPVLMNSGTFTFSPVSQVITFVAPLTVSPALRLLGLR